MVTDKEQFEELCAAYALGALDKEEEALFNETLNNGDEEYQKIFRESIGVSYLINGVIQKVVPLPNVKSSLFRKIKQSNKTSFSFSSFIEQTAFSFGFNNPKFALLISTLLVIIIGEISTFSYLIYKDLVTSERKISIYESRITEQQIRLITLITDLQQKEEILNVLQ